MSKVFLPLFMLMLQFIGLIECIKILKFFVIAFLSCSVCSNKFICYLVTSVQATEKKLYTFQFFNTNFYSYQLNNKW